MRLTEVQRVLGQLQGCVIEGGDETDDGVHLVLADGRIVVFTGAFIIAICSKSRTLQ